MNLGAVLNASNYNQIEYILPYIRYCAEDKYASCWKLKKRKIKDYEFIFVTGGKGEFSVEDKIYPVGENDILLIKPGQAHSGFSVKHPFTFLCIHFDLYLSGNIHGSYKNRVSLDTAIPSKPVRYKKCELDFPTRFNTRDSVFFKSLLKKILSEVDKRQPGYRMIIKSLFLELMLNLFRQMDGNASEKLPEEIEAMIDFIKAHCGQRIFLSEIADHVHLQASYVSGLFKKHMGITITDYIKKYRVSMAKSLLIGTTRKIEDIACETGFYDLHHFSKVFREYEGLTPAQYRKIIK